MRKNTASQSGLFHPRILFAFALCSVGALLAMLSFAATPPIGMTGSRTNSPGDSLFVDKQAGPLSGNAKAASASMPLAPATTGGWSIVASPNSSVTGVNHLFGVTCVSASDCWAVGAAAGVGTAFVVITAQTLIERWNGTSWAIVTSPNPIDAQGTALGAVTCVSASDCWAVGYYTIPEVGSQTLIERWDGTSWAIVTSPNTSVTQDNNLTGVTCASASDCWAVGFYYTGNAVQSGVEQTLIERWDGTSWAIVTSPNTSATQNNYLQGVTCASASDCWAVAYYVPGSGVYQTLMERWNGTSWAIVTSPNTSATQYNTLLGVTCVSTSDCWTVGYNYDTFGAAQTLIERWDGTSWAIVTSPNNPSATPSSFLTSVTCVSASDCWATGYLYDGSNNDYQTLIEGWDGTSWAIVTSPNAIATQTNVLTGPDGVMCASASDCWAVGYYNNGVADQTLIEHYTVPVQLISVVSRKLHGSAGTFDIDLPLTGTRGIECRSGGVNSDYTMVFTFLNPVTNCGAASTGSVSSGPNPNQCTVNLTSVPNAQYLTVTLTSAVDAIGATGNVSGTMGVLVGDVNASGIVTSGDTNLCKAQALQPVTNANFRNDINASGAITTGDVNIIKQNALRQLPSPP